MIKYVEIDDTRIACWINDNGFADGRKNLVFIHGSGGNHSNWESQYTEMAKDYSIVAVDLPGHGFSAGNGEQSIDHYVEWIIKIIDAFYLKKPVIIGHSLGAAISLTCAIKYGKMLSGIVPVGGGVRMPVNDLILNGLLNEPSTTIPLIAKFSVEKRNRERFQDFLVEDVSRVDPHVTYGDYLSCNKLDITEKIAGISIPVLLICGDNDKMTPPTLSWYMKEHITGANLVLIEKSGHYVMMENKEAFNRALKCFVDSL